jgi:peptide/nickel transport system substrate-binding protein
VLREPNPVLLTHLTQLRMMSKAWAVKHGATLPQDYKAKEDTYAARNANGTGAFRLKEYQPDVRLVFAAHKEWWGHAAGINEGNLTEVVMLPIKSNATRIAALLSGEVDFIIDPPTQDVARLRADPNIRILEGAELRVQYLGFDLHRDELIYGSERTKNPFKDIRVRRAVAHAIDAEAIRSKVMRGFSKPIGALITPGIDGYSPEGDIRLPYDRAKARALLAEAGYPNGFEVTLDAGNIQPAADIAQAVVAMLAQVGIRAKANIVPQPTYFPRIERYDTSFYLLSWGGGLTADAYYTLQTVLHSRNDRGDGEFNLGRWADPRTDELLARLRVEPDPVRRRELSRDILQRAAAELPLIPIHQPLIPWAMRKNVTARATPVNTLYFYQTRID